MGGVFFYASIDKIAFPNQFAEIIRNYNILPDALVSIVARVLPFIELILGIFLISGVFSKISALSLSILLIIFIIAIGINSITGHYESCGCFSVSNQSRSSSAFIVIVRNFFLIIIGTIIFLKERDKVHESK